MANVSFRLEVTGLKEMTQCFERGTAGLGLETTAGLEETFAETFEAVVDKTHYDEDHVDPEIAHLKETGLTATDLVADEWEGEMTFARNPGIFELARGNTPSKNHPEGGHFFFEAVEPFFPKFDHAVDGYFRNMFGEA